MSVIDISEQKKNFIYFIIFTQRRHVTVTNTNVGSHLVSSIRHVLKYIYLFERLTQQLPTI